MKKEGQRGIPQDICDRTFTFSLRILKLVSALPNNVAGRMIARQIVRSGTSIGANAEEARGSTTKKEYSRKMSIALSEARETHYWLRLVAETGLLTKRRLDPLVQEADELVRILVTIVKRTRASR